MDLIGVAVSLLVGAAAGFLAGQVIKGHGFGLLGNVIVGILGAFVFGFLFGSFELLGSPVLNAIVGSTIGAIILLFVIGLFKKG